MRGFSDRVAPHHITIEAYGLQMRISVSTEELMSRARALLPPGYKEVRENDDAHAFGIVEEEDGTYSVYTGSNRACERGTLELALVIFNDQIHGFVALYAKDIFVHAGVIARDGEAIVIPGDSFSGKSTLIETLVRRGAVYFSDEFAVFDEEGRVHPYPRPLVLRQLQNQEDPWSGRRAIDELGGVAGDESLPMGLAVVTQYVPGAAWNPRRLSRGEAVLALMAKTVPARYRPEQAMRVLSRAVEGVPVLEGYRGEAEEFADLLLEGALV